MQGRRLASYNTTSLFRNVAGSKFFDCSELKPISNSTIPTSVLPDEVHGDKVLVLGDVPRKLDYVKAMTVSA
jgi:hypothetical protein